MKVDRWRSGAVFFAAIVVVAVALQAVAPCVAADAPAAEPRASERVPIPATVSEQRRPAPGGQRLADLIVVPTYADVVYGHAGGRDLLLDAYIVESSEPTPVLIFIHGGGWRGGSKQFRSTFPLNDLYPAGISIVSVEYRFSDVAIHPAQVEDCTRAVQFVRHKAKEWNIDPARVGVMGSSAGAHLALMVGLRDDAADPDSDDPVERRSSRVSCIVSLAGPTDFNLIRSIEHGHPAYRTLLGFKPGTPAEEIPRELLDDVSPITYASADDPPSLLIHGTADTTVPIEHARKLEARLRELGADCTLLALEGEGHGVGLGQAESPARARAVEFVKEHLLGGPRESSEGREAAAAPSE